jgi:hypothetical protein
MPMTERDVFLGVAIARWRQIGGGRRPRCLDRMRHRIASHRRVDVLDFHLPRVAIPSTQKDNSEVNGASPRELEAERVAEREHRLRDRDDIIARQEIERSRIWERINGA